MTAADILKRPRGRISLIVAMAENRVIGHGGTIPWKVPGEQKLFKRITLGHTLIMGRKTHEDIGRPLSGRINIVISRSKDYRSPGCLTAHSLQEAFTICPAEEAEIFIIGGGQLFRESLPITDRVYLTVVPLRVPGDTFFPEIPEDRFAITSSEHFEGPQPYDLHIYDRIPIDSKPATRNPQPTETPEDAGYHMSPAEFRRCGRAVIDWIADYYDRVESLPVLSPVKPGDICAGLPERAPQRGEPFEAILRDVSEVILPGITHWQSPNFFAFFPANASGPAILGDMISSGLAVQGMLWATSPACTELETRMLDWVADMLALPPRFRSTDTGGGVIQDSASSASLCALVAARERATAYTSNATGCDGRLVAYASTQAHSSIEKAAKIAGIGRDNLRLIDVDDRFALRPDRLSRQIATDRQAGRVPFLVSATVGTTSAGAIDPLPEIGRICRDNDLWLHVDAAMAGTAAICPEFRYIHTGLEYADSYCFNPHKWMFTNFDCDCFYVVDRTALIRALSILPEYLRNQATETGAVFDYRDWQIPLGRRFRALKLWFVIRHYGVDGLQHHVRRHVALAQEFARWVQADGRFELAAQPPLNLVCFRHRGGDSINQNLMDRLNLSGDLYLTHTRLQDRMTLRLCVGQTRTERRHVERAWQRIRDVAADLADSS